MEDYLLYFASIAASCNNVPVCVLGTLAKLNNVFNFEVQYRLDRLKKIYLKYSRRLADGYHKKLIAHPVDYNGFCTRVVPIPNMMNSTRGVMFMCADPPVFTDAFLSQKYPALTNICLMLRHPVEFYYKICHPMGFVIIGKVSSDNIVELPFRTEAGRERMLAKYDNRELPPEMLVPGRYFVDLQLPFLRNPALFSRTNFHFDHLSLGLSDEIMWYDSEGSVNAIFTPNIDFTYKYVTHMILQFKTAPIDTPVDHLGVYYSSAANHIDKFSLIRDVEKMEREIYANLEEYAEPPEYQNDDYSHTILANLTADDLLDEIFSGSDQSDEGFNSE